MTPTQTFPATPDPIFPLGVYRQNETGEWVWLIPYRRFFRHQRPKAFHRKHHHRMAGK